MGRFRVRPDGEREVAGTTNAGSGHQLVLAASDNTQPVTLDLAASASRRPSTISRARPEGACVLSGGAVDSVTYSFDNATDGRIKHQRRAVSPRRISFADIHTFTDGLRQPVASSCSRQRPKQLRWPTMTGGQSAVTSSRRIWGRLSRLSIPARP